MILLMLFIVPRVLSEIQHHVYMSPKLRSNLEPFQTGYTYNHVNKDPGTLSTFNTEITSRKFNGESSNGPVQDTYSTMSIYDSPTLQYPHPMDLSKQIFKTSSATVSSLPKRDMSSITSSELKYNAGFLPSKIKTDVMYEHLKSAMRYQPSTETMFGYETEYHLDDDDIRTSSREPYDSWPHYYYNPYEYEHIRIDSEKEKAKEKRYAVDATKIIPIHEDLSHDIPNSQTSPFTTEYYSDVTTDNPISGHEPFFSFMFNDYFHKNDDSQDQLTFKEPDWGKDFSHELGFPDIDVFTERNRRLPSSYIIPEHNSKIGPNLQHEKNKIEAKKDESVTEKGFSSTKMFDKHEKSEAERLNDKNKYQQNGQQSMANKDFLDNFTNKFGMEDHKKDSKFSVKRNQDNGQNKKGFRRVFHKDEYQEDNEFYDNNNSSAQFDDKGSSNVHIGGSEALLKSQAFAKLGNQASAFDKSGNKENNKFENNLNGFDKSNGFDSQFHRYRDVAKSAAQSNGADYSDHWRLVK